MAKACMRTDKISVNTVMASAAEHNLRLKPCSSADPELAHTNIILKSTIDIEQDFFKKNMEERNESCNRNIFKKMFDNRVKEVGCKVHKNSVRMIECTVRLPRDAEKRVDIDDWRNESIKWANEEFGKDNIVSIIEHNDEGARHMHMMIVPIENNRLNGHEMYGNRNKMSARQASYSDKMQKIGLDRVVHGKKQQFKHTKEWNEHISKIIDKNIPTDVEVLKDNYKTLLIQNEDLKIKLRETENDRNALSSNRNQQISHIETKLREKEEEIKELEEVIENTFNVKAKEFVKLLNDRSLDDKDKVHNGLEELFVILREAEENKQEEHQEERDEKEEEHQHKLINTNIF